MKNLINRPVLFLLLLLLTAVGCKKDKDTTPNRTSLLTAKEWKVDKFFADGIDISSALAGRSYRFKFNENGTYTESLDQQSGNGTWKFTTNETKLLLDEGTNDEYTADILLLDANSLNVQFEETDENGDTYMIELRMIH